MDPFKKLLTRYPFRHALWRALEVKLLSKWPLSHPILDLGCGDGFFTSILVSEGKIIGLDYSPKTFQRRKMGTRQPLILANAAYIPIKSNYFNTVLCNSALEHMENCDLVIAEAFRILKNRGQFLLTIPTNEFSHNLFWSNILYSAGLNELSSKYTKIINEFLCHKHLLSIEAWREKLEKLGFRIIDAQFYLSKRQTFLWDLFSIGAFLSELNYRLFGRYILLPQKVRLIPTRTIYKRLTSAHRANASCAIIVAQKDEGFISNSNS